jgi:hypothetical protein
MSARRFFYRLAALAAILCYGSLIEDAASAQTRGTPAATQGQEGKATAKGFSLRRDQARWSLVSPDGKPFFSLGVCCVSQGPSRADYDPENPGYARWRFYDSPSAWADNSLRRLKSWGFTTVGGWSDYEVLCQSKEMPVGFTPVLHLGATAGAPWWDMWDEKIVARMEDVARRQIVAVRNDPRLIGYYSDNEMGWWNATLFKMTFEHSPTSGQRQRLIKLLRETYYNDWQKLLADFEPVQVNGWDELDRGGRLHLKPGGNGIRVMRQFLGMLAERYYQLAHEIIRKHDPRALFLGDRYQSFYYPEVARAAARHVDVVSTNLNAHWNDGTFLRSYLDTLHALTGKPIIVSEMYLAATENRSGNRNTSGVFPVVATQGERVAATRNTLNQLVKLPYVVGVDWFQYTDEPTHGREDGENFNFGLVDIHDRPYEELVGAFKEMGNAEWGMGNDAKHSAFRIRHSALSDVVPPSPKDSFAEFKETTALKHWDRNRGFVPASSEFPVGDLYVCWSPQALYLGFYGWDAIDEHYYASGSVPKVDRAVWIVTPMGNEDKLTLRATIGAGREALVNDPTIRVESLSGTKLTVRLIAVMEVPAAQFGKERFVVGDTVEFSSTLTTHARAYEMEWKGQFRLEE